MSVYMMIGQNDFRMGTNKMAERMMMENGVRVKLVVYEGLGHAFPPSGKEELTKALQWIGAAE